MALSDVADDLRAGQAALAAADWAAARVAFGRALAAAESPDAHDGLGIALWWLNDIDAAHEHRALAYRALRQTDPGRAARIACWLGREQVFLRGNVPAMQGWFRRAGQLVALPAGGVPAAAQAWVALLRASLLAAPEEMAALAAGVIATAQQAGDGDLEAFALAFQGQALVALGQVDDGLAELDEAMTMATAGEVADLMIISEIFCVMLSTCEVAGDLARSDQWCAAALAFAQRYRCPFLLAYCRTSYGGLMTALGRWAEAEAALDEAIRAFERGHRGLRVHAVIRLADLRVSQGRVEEAAVLLAGLEDQAAAVIPLARLHLLKGEWALARAVLEQALPPATATTLHQWAVLLLLVEVLLAGGDVAGARRVMAALTQLAADAHSPLLTAQVEFTRGCVNLHAGDLAAARAAFTAALDPLRAYEQSLLAGQVRLRMALALTADDPPGAVAWAKGALATFERLGATADAAQAAGLLRRLGVAPRPAPRTGHTLTAREAEIAALVARGLTNREIAERLVLSAKTVEHHVSRILDKLGLQSRVEVAALAAAGHLPPLLE